MIIIKEKLRKGTFSGVIPMMGLFVMAALMGFQSIPISQAFAQEMTQSYNDLTRITKSKSFANLYFFNYVPTGAEYSINQKSYELGQVAGNVSWSSSEFSTDNTLKEAKKRKVYNMVYEQLKPNAREYINEKYGVDPGSNNCNIPSINYTTKIMPEYNTEDQVLNGLGNYSEMMPAVVRSEVDVNFFSVDAAPIEVECTSQQGSVKFIGDTTNSGTNGGGTGGFLFFSNWNSVGYTNELNVSANRYHILARETTEFYKRLYDRWSADVSAVTNTKQNVCDPSTSDWTQLESSTVNDVNGNVTTPFNNLVNSEVDVNGISGDFSLSSYNLNFEYGTYTKKFNGTSNNSKTDVGDCQCEDDHDSDSRGPDPGQHCHADEYDLSVTVTPQNSEASSNMTDDRYRVMTEQGWKNLEFDVASYPHDFQSDGS